MAEYYGWTIPDILELTEGQATLYLRQISKIEGMKYADKNKDIDPLPNDVVLRFMREEGWAVPEI